jgi:hypothetical protein
MPTRYDELYRQSQLTNQNTRQPIGGSTTLMGGINPAMMAGVAQSAASMFAPPPTTRIGWGGFDLFGGLQQPQQQQTPTQPMETPVTTPADMNEEVAYTGGQTFRDIRMQAEREELARLAQLRQNQMQGAAMQGSSMYEQARMAMSQRQLMSDARGLSGGAQEFAERGLGAQEQMALAQIKMGTTQQLLEIEAASLQDPRIAQEFGARAAELAKQDDPRLITAEGILQQAQMAREEGNLVEANRLTMQYFEQINELYGSSIPTGPGVSPEVIDQALVSKIADIANERTAWGEIVGWAGALGVPAAAGVGGASFASGIGTGLAAVGGKIGGKTLIGKVAAKLLIGAGTVVGGKVILGLAIAGAVIWAGSNILKEIDRSVSGDAAVARVAQELSKRRTQLEDLGYDEEQIDAIIAAEKELAGLPPKYANIG